MRQTFLTAAGATVVFAVAALASAGVSKGMRAPDFSLATLDGGKTSLSSHRGQVVVVDFWAQWCEPCKKELPELQKLATRYAGKNVTILAINIDKERGNAERLVRQLGLTLPVLFDPSGSVAGAYDLPKMPSSFVVDKKGVVRYVHGGFDGSEDVKRFETEINQLLK